MQAHFVWKFGRVVNLLEEPEWSELEPLLLNPIEAMKAYRKRTGLSLSQARQALDQGHLHDAAMQKYFELTNEHIETFTELYHVRLSIYGRPCPVCQKLMRTPEAKLCAACGYQLPDGEVAGPCRATG